MAGRQCIGRPVVERGEHRPGLSRSSVRRSPLLEPRRPAARARGSWRGPACRMEFQQVSVSCRKPGWRSKRLECAATTDYRPRPSRRDWWLPASGSLSSATGANSACSRSVDLSETELTSNHGCRGDELRAGCGFRFGRLVGQAIGFGWSFA